MALAPGKTYQIVNKRSNLALTPKSWSTGPSTVDQYDIQASGAGNAISQTWHLFPMDGNDYLLVNKRGGMALTPEYWSTGPSGLDQYHIQREDKRPHQLWNLVDRGSGWYQIINKASGLAITPERWSGGRSAVDVYYAQQPGDANFDSQLWKFQLVDTYRPVTDLQPVPWPADGVGDVIRLTGHTMPEPARTPEVLIGQVAVPFAVQDGGGSADQQAQHNPYLILKQYGYWERVFYYEHSGLSQYEEKQRTTIGLTTSNRTEVERTTSISVTAEAGFVFKGFSAGISTTVTDQLRVLRATEETETSEKEDIITRTYFVGDRVTEALWYRGDHFVLQRMDGSQVAEWRTRDKRSSVLDGWPRAGDAASWPERGDDETAKTWPE
ncbi:Insecticidal Crystal Toxin, P42 [Streptomyces sp. 2231.1]|uniref:RICIN domain-containing protein n=1 Tax=Streptomyces sp. 2231.1 TaxID=1855347 RepID=UPI000895B96A|nr:RICIN domain-containing protein [Streptomyces sp. 2231.1]SEC10046.1 Insecticidal Crystal Toxin, P42 [Streptomyces sp. 2231.1]